MEIVERVPPSGTFAEDRSPVAAAGRPALLVHGDNLAAMAALSDRWRGRVALAYADPPFFSGTDHHVSHTGALAFRDRPSGGLDAYLAMLEPRLRALCDLLSDDGTLYVHVDPTAGHYVKVMLDGILGRASFQREIVWRIGWVSGFKTRVRGWVRNHDCIYQYAKDPKRYTWNRQLVAHPPGYKRRGAQGKAGGIPVDDVWNANEAERLLSGEHSLDSIQIKSFSSEKTGYPTQKNESLLRRIVSASSNVGDVVCDVFAGSGTTLAVAEQLGRGWIGVDESDEAIRIARARLAAMPERRAFEVWRLRQSAPPSTRPRSPSGESHGAT